MTGCNRSGNVPVRFAAKHTDIFEKGKRITLLQTGGVAWWGPVPMDSAKELLILTWTHMTESLCDGLGHFTSFPFLTSLLWQRGVYLYIHIWNLHHWFWFSIIFFGTGANCFVTVSKPWALPCTWRGCCYIKKYYTVIAALVGLQQLLRWQDCNCLQW